MAGEVALDTEGDSLHHYPERLSLLQLASSAGEIWLVDPLVLDDLSPLAPVFAEPGIVTVLHAGDNDLAHLKRRHGFRFAALFDTYVAARFLGEPALGLDVLLVYFAFRVNYRTADAFEQVTMTPSELRVRKVSHRGKAAEWMLNPLWTRIDRETHEEFGLLQLFLVSRGWRLAVASFLGPKEKEGFAQALSAALSEAKRGPTRTIVT